MKTIDETLNYAIEQHSQTNAMDKTGTTPYYWHLLRVMLRVKENNLELAMVTLLHDVLEDTNATEKELRELFGNKVTDNVIWCSKNFFKELSFKQWMQKISDEAPDDVIKAKLADISDNLGFERMRGLMPVPVNHEFSYVKKINPDIQKRITSITKSTMKLRGEMGVYDRYYIAWNIIMSNPKNYKFLNQIETGDFSHLEQLKRLNQYIPQDQYINYMTINKLNTWKISGEVSTHYDKNKQPYIAVEIPVEIGSLYQKFLLDYISGNFIENQKNRDNQKFHITLLNVADFSQLKKKTPTEEFEKIITQFKELPNEFYTYGIGKNTKNESLAYFVILENAYVNTLRKNIGLKEHDLHLTLAFEPKDVHGVVKNKSTIEYSNEQLWKHFVEKDFKHNTKNTTKLKF